MTFATEPEFEEAMIRALQRTGWDQTVLRNPTEQDLLDNWARILFENNRGRDQLNDAPLTKTEMDQICGQIEKLRTPMRLNRFVNGRTVAITRDNPADPEHLGREVSLTIYNRREIAGGSSRYQIAQQPRFSTSSEVLGGRRGDLMLLINGMPLFHLELKGSKVPVERATSQLERYASQGVYTGLFSLVQVFVASTPETSVYFANPGPDGKFNKDYFFHWADFNNERIDEWHKVATSLLSIPMAHQLIGFYTVADDTDGVLKVMRSYQYYAANRISDRVAKADWESRNQRGGYIWHTTGSGKTMTSFKSAQLIANSQDADKVVFLMDRIELGTQSLAEYRGFADDAGDVQETEDTQVLIGKLKSDDVDDTLIVTSIQKMSNINDEYGVRKVDLARIARKRLVFIVDEAHRSTFGDMLLTIKRMFPKALFFGFTGTPIQEENQKKLSTTSTIFGDELHRYTIADGIRDNNVLGFDLYRVDTYKESDLRRVIALEKAHAAREADVFGDPQKERIFDRYMDPQQVSMAGGMSVIGRHAQGIEDLLPTAQYNHPAHRRAVLDDIAQGWVRRSRNSKFHAILATSSIPEAIEYYRLAKQLRPDLSITALFDPDADEGDAKIMKESGVAEILDDYNARYRQSFTLATHGKFKKDVSNRLAHKKPHERIDRTPEDQLDLLIVVDQMLTGFDSKWVNTLYLDKVLAYENIIQAFSRTNRLFGPDKQFGTIRYYRKPATMQQNIDRAVELYSGDQPLQLFVDHLSTNLEWINDSFATIARIFAQAGIADFSRNPDDPSECGAFAKQFSLLNAHLEAATVQGFTWDAREYKFEADLRHPAHQGPYTVIVSFDEETYLTLALRYKELASRGGGGGGDAAYIVETHLTEIDTSRIDADYMNSRFDKYLKALEAGNASPQERLDLLHDLHGQFALLSQDEQKHANMFLHDVANGDVDLVPGKTFRDYITDYQLTEKEARIRLVRDALGVDEGRLRQLLSLSPTEKTLNEFGRFDQLRASIDVDASRSLFERMDGESITEFEARKRSSRLLRELILRGELPSLLIEAGAEREVDP